MTYFVGLGHYSRTGKDTLANYLLLSLKRRKISAVKRPFAWKLKEISHQLYGWAGVREPEHYDTASGEKDRDVVIPALGMTPVELWVKLGTPAIRKNIYDATWVDYVMYTDHNADVVIIPDVRFENEANCIHKKHGLLVKVVRPGIGPKTEIDRQLESFDDWDMTVGEGGTIEELHEAAKRIAKQIAIRLSSAVVAEVDNATK